MAITGKRCDTQKYIIECPRCGEEYTFELPVVFPEIRYCENCEMKYEVTHILDYDGSVMYQDEF